MRLFILGLILCVLPSLVNAQSIEDELGFIYVKAEYLMETGRYDEAISEYSSIIQKNPKFKEALVRRAEAKYNLKSFSGVKADILELINIKGIDAKSVKLLGLVEHELGNHGAAVNSLILAQQLEPRNLEIIEALALSASASKTTDACTVLRAVKASPDVDSYLATYCSGETVEVPKGNTTTKPPRGRGKTELPKQTETNVDIPDSVLEEEVVVEEKPKVIIDDSVNTILIDEDLTILVKNGLGSRKIIDQPNILMLSDRSGEVVVDICVSKGGRVETAEIDKAGTTITSESLQSLAIRKAKEFWFLRGTTDSACGSIVFVINQGM